MKNYEKSKKKLEKKAFKLVNLEEAIIKLVVEKSVEVETVILSDTCQTSLTSDINSNVSCILASSSTCSTSKADVTTSELISDTHKSPSNTPPGTPPRQSPPPGKPPQASPPTGTPLGTPQRPRSPTSKENIIASYVVMNLNTQTCNLSTEIMKAIRCILTV